MKRKILVSILAGLLLAGEVFAQGETHAKFIYTFEARNTSGINSQVTSTLVIRPGVDKVLGYAITALDPSKGSENTLGVYDLASSGDVSSITLAESLGEIEAQHHGSADRFFPMPRKVLNGTTIIQGPNTLAQIFFIKE